MRIVRFTNLVYLSALHSYLLHVSMCLHAFIFHMAVNFTCLSYVLCYFSCLLLRIDVFSNLKHSLLILGTQPIAQKQKKYVYSLKSFFTAGDYLLFKFLFLSWKFRLLFRCICKKKSIFQRLKYLFKNL